MEDIKNCSVIYLSQSYYKTPKVIRMNCSHFCIYEFPSNSEKSLICSENNTPKEVYEKATKDPYSFIYIDKPRTFTTKNFNEQLYYTPSIYMSCSNGLLESTSTKIIKGIPGVGFKLPENGN